jgi:hypothetical protein
VNGRVVFDSSLTRPNPNWNDIMSQGQPGWAHYNSLQLSLKQRLSHGLQATFNYAYARNTDNTSDYKDRIAYIYNPDLYRSLSQLDVRHLFSFYSTYQLPVGKGKAFLSNMGGVGENILGGWEVNGIITLRTGFPGDVSTAVPTFLSGIGMKVARPDLVAGANNNPTGGTSPGCQISNTGVVFAGTTPPAGTTISQTIAAGTPLGTPSNYLDPCSFQFPPTNTLGNLGRNTVTFPGLKNVDFSLAKDFKITERTKLQFRSEFFNILNHPNFAAPDLRAFNAKGVPSNTFGRITTTVATARQIQFGLRLEF